MIPPFDANGCLPAGIHRCSWTEFSERFVVFDRTDQRLRIGEKIRGFFDEVRNSGIVLRLYIAGSYVTEKAEPNDFDCLLVIDPQIVHAKLPPFQYNVLSRRMVRK